MAVCEREESGKDSGAFFSAVDYNGERFVKSRTWARFATLAACVVLLLNLDAANAMLFITWDWLREQWWFKHDSFEPVWSTMSFAAWLNWFGFVDAFWDLKRYIIDPDHRHVDHKTGVPFVSGGMYLFILLGFDVLYPRRKLPQEGPSSLLHVLGGISMALFLYDFIFFHFHLAMHRVKFLRKFHSKHHTLKSQGLYSTETLRHSFVDGSLQVGTNIFVLNVLGLHPFTRMLYDSVITYMLTEIHCGYDMPWMAHNVLPRGVLGGSRRHEVHHKSGKQYFSEFFCCLDDFLLPFYDRQIRRWENLRLNHVSSLSLRTQKDEMERKSD